MRLELTGTTATLRPRPRMPPFFEQTFGAVAEAEVCAQWVHKQLLAHQTRMDQRFRERADRSRERFLARLRARRKPAMKAITVHAPYRRESTARTRPREHRRQRSRSPGRPDDEPELDPRCGCCGGRVSSRFVLCRGFPNPGVAIERLAAGVGQVDRAARAFKAGVR